MENQYIFSIVMAIYNTKQFLREALDSIVNQDVGKFNIPFEKIVQVIMVDDGSNDGSEDIIEEYAAAYPNFIAVHKKNGGLSSARNAGMKHIKGKYMNFMDSDDKISENVLWEVYSFFEKHYEETDMVSMPMKFFDAMTGDCWENDKFRNGSRVINLYREYNVTAMFVTCNYFKSEYKERICFDEKLVICEDIKFTCTMMLEKMTLGVVDSCTYFYRQRTLGEESLIQASKNNPNWYFNYFTYSFEWVIDYALKNKGYVPYYIQYVYAMDIGWRFSDKYESTALALLGNDEYERYKQVLAKAVRNFDDEIIMSEDSWPEYKALILRKKYDKLPQLLFCSGDIGLCYNGNKPFYWISDCYTMIEKIAIKDGKLKIEGYTMVFGLPDDEPVNVILNVRCKYHERIVRCEINTKRDVNIYRLDDVLYRGVAFGGEVALNAGEDKAEISIICEIRGYKVRKKDIRYGTFSPIGTEYGTEYYIQDGYIVTRWYDNIYFEKYTVWASENYRRKHLAELKTTWNADGKKAYRVIKSLKYLKALKRNRIWLISDEPNKAEENGEALFDYICRIKPGNTEVYFVIDNKSPDYERIAKTGKTVQYLSRKHKLLFLLADVVVSSSENEYFFNPFGEHEGAYRKYISEKRYVYLPKNVIQNDESLNINKYSRPVKGFVTASNAEKNSILRCNYNYDESEVWLTGAPKYDLMYDNRKKQITIIPDLRRYIMRLINGEWYTKNNFGKSEYRTFYNSLINNEKLLSSAKEFGYTIRFISHVSAEDVIKFFNKNENVIFEEPNVSYRKVFAESDMVVTDYSSAAFDFAYLRKPLIYAQFDVKNFHARQEYVKDYFDYERDGFGEVTYNLDSTVDMIIEYMKNDCQLKDKYRERIDNFFAFNDKNNCQRVYNKIIGMLEEK